MAEIVHQEVIDIQVKNGDKNIKDLRKQIRELKDEIANMALNGKNATEQQKQLTAANKELADAMAEVNKVVVENINDTDISTMSYNEMSKELNLLRKAAKDAGDAITRQKYAARIQELDKALKSMDAEMGVFNRNVGNYSEGVEKGMATVKQQIRQLQEELTRLSPATEEYTKKLVELAEKQRMVADIQEEAKFASQDFGDRLATITKVGSNLASGFAAVQGAMALFGTESENIGKVLVKLQAIMAVVQGLDGLDGLGKNLKGLSRSFAPAIQAVKSFIGGLTGMKAAIAGTGIGLLAIGLGAVAANWDKIKQALGVENEHDKQLKSTRQEAESEIYSLIDNFLSPNPTPQIERSKEKFFEFFADEFENDAVTGEDLQKFLEKLTNRKQYEILSATQSTLSAQQLDLDTKLRAIAKKYGVNKIINGIKAEEGKAEPRFTADNLYNQLGFSRADAKEYSKLFEQYNSLSEQIKQNKTDLSELSKNMYQYPLADLQAKIDEADRIRRDLLSDEEKINREYDEKIAALAGAPKYIIDAVIKERDDKLAELHKQANAETEKAAKELAEKQAKVQERFAEEGLIAEIEARKKQYEQDLALFKNNAEMRKKLTIEYYADLQLIDRKYLKKYAEESAEVYNDEYQKRIAGLAQQYIEAAAQPTGNTPTQMDVEQPSAWTEDTVLAYAAETAAAQAFYESEIGYQNTVMQNQITILTNMRDIARQMGNTDAAIEYTRQINVLQDSIAANDTKVAEQRVVNQKNIENAQKATNKEGEVTKWTLENTLNLGQSVGKIFGSVASMMDKNSEEGLAAYKAFATAGAIIDTLASATAAYKSLAGIPIAGPALGAAAAAAAIAAGMANVMQIQKTTIGGSASVDNTYGSSSVNAPDVNAWEPQYTRNLQTDSETDKLNQPIYVTVTDIKQGLNKQAKVVDAAKF